jgi:RNA polymerase sigma-70 factor (ECF subfamily)
MSIGSSHGTGAQQASLPLAARIRAGDRAAEEELVTTYRRAVLVIAIARTRNPDLARDLTQDVFIAVLKALREGQLRETEKLAGFIQGTARNIINGYLRSQTRHPESDLEEVELSGPDPVEDLESAERQRLVRQELASFPVMDQQILLLSLVDGHSLAEVAKRLNLSHEAVRARKSRMVRKFMAKFARASQR